MLVVDQESQEDGVEGRSPDVVLGRSTGTEHQLPLDRGSQVGVVHVVDGQAPTGLSHLVKGRVAGVGVEDVLEVTL